MTGDDREAHIRTLLPLVKQIARRIHRLVPKADLDDMIGDGCVGAVRAVDAFDPRRGVPLEQYAKRVILGAVLNGVRRMDPVPERMRRTIRNAHRTRFALAQELGTMPAFVAVERMVPALSHARTEAHRRSPLSLDTTLPTGERLELDFSNDPQNIVGERSERERLLGAVAHLPPRHRRIVVAHYFAERTLRELIAPLRISPQRVSQLHLIALKRLRSVLADTA